MHRATPACREFLLYRRGTISQLGSIWMMKSLAPSVVPVMYQTNTTPLSRLRNTRSGSPSAFQSASCTISHTGSIEKSDSEAPASESVPPEYCVYQAKASPELMLRKSRSG